MQFIKPFASYIAALLTITINNFFQKEKFPDMWKIAMTSPILKIRTSFIHYMWWWSHIQYSQLDSFCLVDKALSLCSCTFVRLDMVDFDVRIFYCDLLWLFISFLCNCSWFLLCFCWRFCVACVVMENVHLIILKSNDQPSLPHFCCLLNWIILCAFLCFLFCFLVWIAL